MFCVGKLPPENTAPEHRGKARTPAILVICRPPPYDDPRFYVINALRSPEMQRWRRRGGRRLELSDMDFEEIPHLEAAAVAAPKAGLVLAHSPEMLRLYREADIGFSVDGAHRCRRCSRVELAVLPESKLDENGCCSDCIAPAGGVHDEHLTDGGGAA